MIDEIAEYNQYYNQRINGKTIYDDDARFKECYFSTGRVLKVIARYYWYHDEKTKNIEDKKEKIKTIKQNLYDFYNNIAAIPYDNKKDSLNKNIKEKVDYRKNLERYHGKDYLEQKDNNFSFYSIIADAVNEGTLKSGAEIEISGGEILCVMQKTEYRKKSGTHNTAVPSTILAMICYYKYCMNDKEELILKSGYVPVVRLTVNAWLANEKSWEELKKWRTKNDIPFIKIKTVRGSIRYKIDFKILNNCVSQTPESVKLDSKDSKRIFSDKDGNLKNELIEAMDYYHDNYVKTL